MGKGAVDRAQGIVLSETFLKPGRDLESAIEGDRAQEGVRKVGERGAKQGNPCGARGTCEVAHVVDHAEDGGAELIEHLERAPDIHQGKGFSRADQNHMEGRDHLDEGQRNVSGPGGKIDDQKI